MPDRPSPADRLTLGDELDMMMTARAMTPEMGSTTAPAQASQEQLSQAVPTNIPGFINTVSDDAMARFSDEVLDRMAQTYVSRSPDVLRRVGPRAAPRRWPKAAGLAGEAAILRRRGNQ